MLEEKRRGEERKLGWWFCFVGAEGKEKGWCRGVGESVPLMGGGVVDRGE